MSPQTPCRHRILPCAQVHDCVLLTQQLFLIESMGQMPARNMVRDAILIMVVAHWLALLRHACMHGGSSFLCALHQSGSELTHPMKTTLLSCCSLVLGSSAAGGASAALDRFLPDMISQRMAADGCFVSKRKQGGAAKG